jgi:hypothetical protein
MRSVGACATPTRPHIPPPRKLSAMRCAARPHLASLYGWMRPHAHDSKPQVGCVFGELLKHAPLVSPATPSRSSFARLRRQGAQRGSVRVMRWQIAGKSELHQIELIFKLLGSPNVNRRCNRHCATLCIAPFVLVAMTGLHAVACGPLSVARSCARACVHGVCV